MIIAVDAAGGDYAPYEVAKGAIKAAQELNAEIALVGKKSMLHVMLSRHLKKLDMTIVNADETIGFHEPPMKAVLSKPNSSIVVGVNLLKEGKADAFVSAGSSGAVLCAALLSLGKIEGVERPAICSTINITPSTAVLVDSGVNVDCRPSFLVEFARLGSVYSREVIGIENPRVGLLNNGEEEAKGNKLAKESHQLLKESGLNFIGNIEGQDILKKTADVIVTDGFTGNIVLKTLEGFGDSLLGQVLSSVSHLQVRKLFQDIGLGSWVKGMDYREYGGASLLGVNGNIIIAHGRSQAKAIKNAIGLAKISVERDVAKAIKEEVNVKNRQRK